ncbi:malate dehydrogenase [Acaryochloris sp. 'Moss Beach']|uniref:malate dehydrogenase n=1 Tax=Acaryochloris sp. 'Moss Beach' TaxID=2740837 RepID=UPI001F35DB2E|nr:malate dehydrogenase [Acaryochloris sp. 'Moss Beach']UJB71024.1 malate dehydrogenase [Acaryochloris sp. 'Moss Beach']
MDLTCLPGTQAPRVTIVGAGNVGSTLGQRIVEKNIADVVLLDIQAGRPQGLALDLMEARGVEHHDRTIIGTADYADTQHSDVIVITAGLPRKPGMSRDDLLKVNAQIITEVTRQAIAQSPNAILVVVTNPLDVMTYLAWQSSGLPPERVVGMAGVLDAARFETFIALELKVSIANVHAMVLGGHGDLMVPLPRYSTVSGIPITELMDEGTIQQLVDRTRNGGAEIVSLMQAGSAYFAPASSASLMVESILFDRSRVLPAAAYLDGQYGLSDIFLGVPTCLSRQGVTKVLELDLSPDDAQALQTSAQAVRKSITMANALLKSQT